VDQLVAQLADLPQLSSQGSDHQRMARFLKRGNPLRSRMILR
jgi:hypothetical protein